MKKLSNQESGLKAKRNGQRFEQILDKYFSFYAEMGYCNIEKTPEPFKFIKPYTSNLFVGCFLKSAQPDYKGTLKGGRSIVLEAKSVSGGKIQLSALTENELKELIRHRNLGACSGVLVYDSEMSNIYLLPIVLIEKMEEIFNKKHIKLKQVKKFIITEKFYKADENISEGFENITSLTKDEVFHFLDL